MSDIDVNALNQSTGAFDGTPASKLDQLKQKLTQNKPVDPTEPKEPVVPTEPKEPVEPTEPDKDKKPEEPKEPTEPKEPVEPAEGTELEATRQQLNLLAAKLMDTIVPVSPTGEPPAKTVPEEAKPKIEPKIDTTKIFADDFLTEDDLGSMNPKEIVGIFNKALSAYTSKVTKTIIGEVLGTVGSSVNDMVNTAVNTNTAIREFFTINKDLVPYSNYAIYKAKEIMQSKGGKITVEELIKETEIVVRKDLNLKKGVAPTKLSATPNLKTTRIPTGLDTRSQLQKELDAIGRDNVS